MRLVLALMLLAWPAAAHDTEFTRDENDWMNRQHAVDGTKCCNEHDVTVGEHVQWRIVGSRYEVFFDGQWRMISPGRMMQSRPDDPTPWPGRALLFRTGPMIWCFFPEPLM